MARTKKSAGTVLVVDDVPQNTVLVSALLRRDGYTVEMVSSGEDAIEAVDRVKPDIILMDVMMPGIDGFEACRLLKGQPDTRLIPVVLLTALTDRQDKILGINAGADDFLTKPVDPQELSARVRSLVRLKRFTDDLDCAESVIVSLAMAIEARDSCTDGHCQRLARYATAMGLHLELTERENSALYRGGFLHDIGKVGIPDAVLLKPGGLTEKEFDCMKRHTVIGDRVCARLRLLQRVRPIVRSHHERLDGSGYPDGLSGRDVPLLAQIMGIVDVFDALTTVRPYKPALPAEEAYAELEREAQQGWRRKDLVKEFVAIGRSGRLESLVSDGAIAFPCHNHGAILNHAADSGSSVSF